MDKMTIKSMIIELKDEGKSFQNISDILLRDYGVRMSRQAVCGMYKRSTSDTTVNTNKELKLATTDIINYSVIGVSNRDIKEILHRTRGVSISLSSIESTIKEKNNFLIDRYDYLLGIVSTKIKNGDDCDSIRQALEYKGEPIREIIFNKLLEDYSANEIKKRALDVLVKVYNSSENKALVKTMSQKFNLNITTADLSKALN